MVTPFSPSPLLLLRCRERTGNGKQEGNEEPYMTRPLEGGGGGAPEEAVGVEEGADAAQRDADSHGDSDAGDAGEGLPADASASAEHEGAVPACHPGDLAGGRARDRTGGGRVYFLFATKEKVEWTGNWRGQGFGWCWSRGGTGPISDSFFVCLGYIHTLHFKYKIF